RGSAGKRVRRPHAQLCACDQGQGPAGVHHGGEPAQPGALRGAQRAARRAAAVSTWAVLVAAGRGERLGGDRPKAFVGLGERVLLAESLERLEGSEWIDAIVVVVPEEWEEPAILLAEELGAGKVNAAVAGGATRADSVRAGLAEIPDDALIALVHDAARPLLPEDVIARVLGGLAEGWDGVVAGLPLADTLKRVDAHGRVAETVDRMGLFA